MYKLLKQVLLLLVLLAPISGSATELWYEDNNLGKSGGMPKDFIKKFDHPESFLQATKYIDVYMVRSNVLYKLDDHFLGQVFYPYLKKNGIKLAIDAGGATYSQHERRSRVRAGEFKLFKRLNRLKVKVSYISLQSILSKFPKENGQRVDYPLEKRMADAVSYTKEVRELFPQVEFGIIDALPSLGFDYEKPYRELKDSLAREGVVLSYIHLDMPFEIPWGKRRGVSWQSAVQVERYVEDELGIKFGYFVTSRKGGHTSSKSFHRRVLGDLECYSGSGGTPDAYIFASWFPYPEKTIPETAVGDDYPTMRIAKELGARLITIDKAGETWHLERSNEAEWRSSCRVSL